MNTEPILFKSLKLELEPGIYYWCQCANNHELVLCESNHTECEPVKFEITEKRLRSYCTCKDTKTAPFCDGFHKELNDIAIQNSQADS